MSGSLGEFWLALALFLAAHSIPAAPGLRRWLVAVLGERLYLGLYSLLSLALLVWLIAAAVKAPVVPLWPVLDWAPWVPVLVMPLAAVLMVSGLTAPNPLSVSFALGVPFDPERPGIVAVTRHPVLWGFGLWAAAHILPNGTLTKVIMFGLFAAFAFAGMALVDFKQRLRLGAEAWRRLAAPTAIVPFAAVVAGRIRLRGPGLEGWRIALALLGYGALLALHLPVIGRWPLPPL
ncbi:NnrU family protein [uncultured Gammaproteobacteria bacterium]